MNQRKPEPKLLSLAIAGLLAGSMSSFAQAAGTDTITGVDSAPTGGIPDAPSVENSTFTVAVENAGGDSVGDFTWDYATGTWSTNSGFTQDATNGNVFIGTFNGNLSVVTLPPDGPGAPGNPPTPGQPNSGISDPSLAGGATLVGGETPNSALNDVNGGSPSVLFDGPVTATGNVVSTGAVVQENVNFTTPDISYTFDDTVDNTNDNISTETAAVAPPVPGSVQSSADQRNIALTDVKVQTVEQGFEAGKYEIEDDGTGAGTGTVEGSKVDLERDQVQVARITGTASTDANGDVTVDLIQEDVVTLDTTGISVENGGNITNTGDLTNDGNATIGGDATIGGNAAVTGDASVGGNAAVTGDASVGGNAAVTGDASVGGNAAVTGDASVGGNAQVDGALNVDGATTTNGITNTGNVGTTTLSTTGNATIGGNAAVAGNASVGGDAEIDGDTVMNGSLTVGGTITTLPNVNMNVVSSTRTASFLNNNNQGMVVGPTSTRISGGTGSTSLILNDAGATFGNGTNGGGPARVTGVADGTQRYDAVNYGQLERAYEGIAGAAALAALPQPAHGKNYSLGVGYGHFAGENAMAVGAKGVYQNFSGTVGGAFTGSEEMVNVGVGYSW